jgi:hypothetical protein
MAGSIEASLPLATGEKLQPSSGKRVSAGTPIKAGECEKPWLDDVKGKM